MGNPGSLGFGGLGMYFGRIGVDILILFFVPGVGFSPFVYLRTLCIVF